MRCVSIFFAFLISANASAWNPFSNEALLDVALSKVELQKVKTNAGWAKDDEQTLIFEVSNGLSGPIQCGVANAELTNGKTVSKVFVPKFAIPGQATRNDSLSVFKGTMQSNAQSCFCYKKKSSDVCLSPLK
jgi:hypothetical protein